MWNDDDDDNDEEQELKEPVPVPQLPWYQTLRQLLEPFSPAKDIKDSDQEFTSSELISSIEQHHGVPQGPVGKEIHKWVFPEDFVRAMRYLGYQEANSGGLQLHWLMKKKS